MQSVLRFLVFLILCLLLIYVSSPAYSQTTTTYTYDGQGRLTEAANDTGNITTFTFDDANNLTKAKSNNGGSNNAPPVCSDVFESTFGDFEVFNGIQGCSDPDGGTLTIISATNPPGAAQTSINSSNNALTFYNMPCNVSTSTRTVSDGQGGTTTSLFEVINLCGGF